MELRQRGARPRRRRLRLEKTTAERRIELTDEQIRPLERFSPEFRERHIETRHTGDLVAVDTFFVGHLKGVGKVYLQSAVDCHSRYAWCRLYPSRRDGQAYGQVSLPHAGWAEQDRRS